MTQTVKGQKNTPQKQNRPGQRQQERLMRLERRRRRRLIWTSVVVALLLIAVASLAFWQYQRITSQKTTTTTAQKTAVPHVGPTCSTASASPAVYNSTPKAGPTNPPSVSGTPAKNSDGLQCMDLKVGTGTTAKSGSSVSVQYTGWLESNGKKFDSSYDHGGQPFTVTLGQQQVIPGWDEGLVGMKAGGIRRLFIPASLAYGAQGQPPTIPPNATLIFDVILVSAH